MRVSIAWTEAQESGHQHDSQCSPRTAADHKAPDYPMIHGPKPPDADLKLYLQVLKALLHSANTVAQYRGRDKHPITHSLQLSA